MKATLNKIVSTRDRLGSLGARLLRVSVVTIAALACFGLLAGGNVYGSVHRAAMDFGDELLRINESTSSGEVRGAAYRFKINGQPILIASTLSKHGATYLLDVFEHQCREHADAIEGQFATLDKTVNATEAPAGTGYKGLATMRNERGGRGFVACFVPGREVDGVEEIRLIGEAAKSGQLGSLGDVRYVVAEDVPEGGSHVIAAWTKGSFDVTKMFPADRDAPGEDIPNAPRPDGSRRILTAGAEGTGYGVVIYEIGGTAGRAYDDADATLARKGWTKAPVPIEGTSHAFSRDGVDLVVTAAPGSADKLGVSYVFSRMGR
jgi:hypothetical protein